MAGEFAADGGDVALDAVTGRATQTARTTYLALLTATPTDATTMATMTELTTPGTNGYARQSVTWSVPADNAGVRKTDNITTPITFGPFTADLGNVTYCALVSASTGTAGDFLAFWSLDTPRDPANGDSIEFAIGALVLNVD